MTVIYDIYQLYIIIYNIYFELVFLCFKISLSIYEYMAIVTLFTITKICKQLESSDRWMHEKVMAYIPVAYYSARIKDEVLLFAMYWRTN